MVEIGRGVVPFQPGSAEAETQPPLKIIPSFVNISKRQIHNCEEKNRKLICVAVGLQLLENL